MKRLVGFGMAFMFLTALTGTASAGIAFADPPGGWTYTYAGDADASGPPDNTQGWTALDGTWSHENGSDETDGSRLGAGVAGGFQALTEGVTTFLRIQDPGDPRDYGGVTDPSNRKIFFGHDITAEGASATILNDGVTISFRARIATTPPLDDNQPDGGGGIVSYPAGGDGYVTHDGGKGNFGICQGTTAHISFSLALAGDDSEMNGVDGLVMNHLNGAAVSGTVDIQGDEAGTMNILPLDPRQWHEYWIVMKAAPAGPGTHKVQVFIDGDPTVYEFDVTAGDGGEYAPSSVMTMGLGATPQSGAIDVDFFSWKGGTHMPPGIIVPASIRNLTPANNESVLYPVVTVKAELEDHNTKVVQDSIVLSVDGAPVPRQIQKVGAITTVSYAMPGVLDPGSAHTATIGFTDDATPANIVENTWSFTVANYPTLGAADAYPAGAGTARGFTIKVRQARWNAGLDPTNPTANALPNTVARAEAQLVDALIDSYTGLPYVNEADTGPNPDGTINEDEVINYEQDGLSAGNFNWDNGFGDDYIPLVPGQVDPLNYENIALEAITYLELASGLHMMGVNSDDGFAVTCGPNARDVFAVSAGQFDTGRSAANTFFTVQVEQAGLYPFRLVWFEGTGGASVEWFSVNPTTGQPAALINDPNSATAIKAWREVSGGSRAYIRSVNPAPGATGIALDTNVVVELVDGVRQVVPGSVAMTLNGAPIPTTASKTGGVTTGTGNPAADLDPGTAYEVGLTFSDNAVPANVRTETWSFSTVPPLVVVEAEAYNAKSPPRGAESPAGAPNYDWTFQTTLPGFSGTGYMEVLPAVHFDPIAYPDFLTQRPQLDYQVEFCQAGTWYMWVRGSAEGGTQDSVTAGINGDSPDSARNFNDDYPDGDTWAWVGRSGGAPRSVEVPSAGVHTINIWMREDGFNCDKLLLTPDPNYTPTGLGPSVNVACTEVTPPEPAEITSIQRQGDAVVLQWTGSGGPYQLQKRASLAAGDWADVGDPTTNTTATVPLNGAAAAYFRVLN